MLSERLSILCTGETDTSKGKNQGEWRGGKYNVSIGTAEMRRCVKDPGRP